IWSFYPKFAWDFMSKYSRAVRLLLRLHRTNRRLQKDPNRYKYTDLAMTPVTEDETEKLELFTHSDAARQAVAHAHKIDQLTHGHKGARAEVHAGRRHPSRPDGVAADNASASIVKRPRRATITRWIAAHRRLAANRSRARCARCGPCSGGNRR